MSSRISAESRILYRLQRHTAVVQLDRQQTVGTTYDSRRPRRRTIRFQNAPNIFARIDQWQLIPSALHLTQRRTVDDYRIVVGHVSRPALFEGQPRLRSVQRLHLTLLVQAENRRALRRIQVQADDGLQFLSESGIVADLESLYAVGLQTMRPPDAEYGGVMPTSAAMDRVLQWVAFRGFSWVVTRYFMAICAAILPSRTCCWMLSGSNSTSANRRDTQLALRSKRHPNSSSE